MHWNDADAAMRTANVAFSNAKGRGIILVIRRTSTRIMRAEICMMTIQNDTSEGETATSRIHEDSMFTDREGILIEDIVKIVFVSDERLAKVLRGCDEMFGL